MMDYAARLGGMTADQNLPQGTAQALTGDYAQFLTGAGGQPQGQGGYQLSADNAMVTPEQKSILDMMLGIYNNPEWLANAKSRGPK